MLSNVSSRSESGATIPEYVLALVFIGLVVFFGGLWLEQLIYDRYVNNQKATGDMVPCYDKQGYFKSQAPDLCPGDFTPFYDSSVP